MIKLSEILTQDDILIDCHFSSKKRALEMLSKRLAEQAQTVAYQDILTSLIDRENLGSTAIGHGVALPHARFEKIDRPIAAIIRLSAGEILVYDDENEKIDILFGLIVPCQHHEDHLQLLANIASHFRDNRFRNAFREAKNAQAAYALFSTPSYTDIN